ncbi:hypothetical protein [Flavobacterium caeni]|uniref:Uncharacterized protein n=1 Tax=Flavobacterium caeni TaxID=490189 RepID=A0A1G5BLM0_9FLAO|nr:hypothetical protein [Flavobacterium caeni]SCX91017.1 hypothetical protein SAMN02927903_00412 [Flavobacterium caeni]
METKTYHRGNFHKHTFCVFRQVGLFEIAGLTLGYKSKSGSSYYFTNDGVYRLSNHWGRAANCKWRLESNGDTAERTKLGYAAWTWFCRDNDQEKLYFIEWVGGSVQFAHKDQASYNGQFLRTASDTMKRIRQIRNLLENDGWTAYYRQDNPEALKENVVHQMIATDQSLSQIKSAIKNSNRK